MPLLVVGSVAIDTIRTPDGKEHKDVLGGSCTYFSHCASFFTKVRVVAVVGEDFDSRHVRMLKNRGVDLEGLEVKRGGKTFRWAGTYAEDMNTRTTDDLQFGVLGEFDPVLPESYRDTEFVFLACAQPELQLKVMGQMRGKPLVVCDTIEFYIQNNRAALEEVFRKSDGVILNDGEARMLTGEKNLIRAADKLLKLGPKFAVLKKGEHGALLAAAGEIYAYPAFPLRDVADPTGAGDSFAGGFMGYLAQSGKANLSELRNACVYGTAAASFTCEGISLNRLEKLLEHDLQSRAESFRQMLRVP